MKTGAEPKKMAILGGLVLVGGYLFYTNVLSGPPTGPEPQRDAAPARVTDTPMPLPAPAGPQASVRRTASRSRVNDDFRPSLKRRPDDSRDPMSIDPTLRLDLLAKVQAVAIEGGQRNLFQFSAAPPPPLPNGPEPKIVPKLPGQPGAPGPKVDAGPPKPPPPPPINLKYYGYSSTRGNPRKTAFFLDGEDILVAGEGDVVKRRYKVVRIGVSSVLMEDTESKNRQTLQLAEEAVG